MATGTTDRLDEAGRSRFGRRVVVARLLMAWVFLVSLYFLWEAFVYRGLYALLAEWQFEQFGHYLPVLTFALLVLLFGSPAAWLLKARRRADRRDLADRRGRDAAIATAMNFRQVLVGFGGGLAGAAIVTLLYTVTLPTIARPRQIVTLGAPSSAAPELGPSIVQGAVVWTRTSAFAQDLLVTARGVRFAPMVAPGSRSRAIRYFVELLPTDQAVRSPTQRFSPRSGVLMRNNLPGSIVRLYRYAGYEVTPPYYVLYASNRTIRWPFYLTALQLALGALVALLAALIQHRHIRKLLAPADERQRVSPGAGSAR